MDDEIRDDELLEENMESSESEGMAEGHSDYKPVNRFDAAAVHHLSGMYQNWFLDYASYSILDRAIPHIEDGFKPVQRRIMHSMKRMDDGRYNKVANIVLVRAKVLGGVAQEVLPKRSTRGHRNGRRGVSALHVHVPRAGVAADLGVVRRAVHLHVEADLLERRLRRLGEQRQLKTPGVGQPAHGERLAVLLANAVAVGVHPARLLEELLGLRRGRSRRW